jgi:hypothetical protein
MRIWKWKLKTTDLQTVFVPEGAKLLNIQVQRGEVCLWALCDEKAPEEARQIAIYGTGNPIPDELGEYIGTFQALEGLLVFHVFEVTK